MGKISNEYWRCKFERINNADLHQDKEARQLLSLVDKNTYGRCVVRVYSLFCVFVII